MAGEIVYIDFQDGVKRVMNNVKLYVKLLVKFKDGTKFEELEDSLVAENWEKAQSEAHAIKGVAANLSLSELFKQSLELEIQIKAKAIKPGQLETVKNVFTKTLQEVNKVIEQNA